MKERTKNKISELFLSHLEAKYPELTESQRWKIGTELSNIAHEIVMQTNHDMGEAYNKNILELEQHRKQFKEHIEFLDKYTKELIQSFKRQGFLKVQEDRKKGKNVLVGRTSMVTDMVDFLNVLNSSVIEFYKNVYKIEEDKLMNSSGVCQTALF